MNLKQFTFKFKTIFSLLRLEKIHIVISSTKIHRKNTFANEIRVSIHF